MCGGQIDQRLRQLDKWSCGDVFCPAQKAGRTLLHLGPGRDFVSAHAAADLDPAGRLHDAAQEYLSLLGGEVVEQDSGVTAQQRLSA